MGVSSFSEKMATDKNSNRCKGGGDWNTGGLCSALEGVPVLVIGDLILDHYIWGDAYRISPEAPVPVVSVERDSHSAGGAANVALNIRSLGGAPTLAGIIGDDEPGGRLVELLRAAGVGFSVDLCQRVVSTIVKTRVVVRQQQLCRLDREALPALYKMDSDVSFAALAPILDTARAVIISDYAKGVVTAPLVNYLIGEGKRRGLLVAIDPKPSRPLDYNGVGLMTPNMKEALELAGIPFDRNRPFPAREVCERIWERHQPRHLVVTLGAEGMLLCESGRVIGTMPTYAQEVYDVSGAGDTVIAALALALASGCSIEEAAHLANTAAGVVVGKLGTATVTCEEILDYERETHAADLGIRAV